MFIFTAILILSLKIPLLASLEIGEPAIRNFEPKEYKGHSQVSAIVQDGRGVMFFGTNNNLIEFDGKFWRSYNIPNRAIRSLGITDEGTIYVGGFGEFGYLVSDSRGQLVYQSLLNKVPKDDQNFTDVWKIHITSHGVYFGTLNKIFRWHQNKIFTLSKSYGAFVYKISDEIYFKSKTGINRIKQGKLEQLPGLNFMAGKGKFIILPFKQKNQLIIITNKGACYIYNLEEGKNSPGALLRTIHTETGGYLFENKLYDGMRLKNGQYALSTRKGGIVIIDAQGKLVRIINENRGLLNRFVLSLFEDRANNLWAGMLGGIAYIELNSPFSRFGKLSGIRSLVTAVTRHQGRIYAGTFTEGPMVLSPYQLKTTDDSHMFKGIDNFKSLQGWDFLTLGKKLLVAAYEVTVIDDHVASIIKDTPMAYCMHISKKFPQTVFLGLSGIPEKGLGKLEILADGGFAYRGKLAGISHVIRNIVSDNQGNLWLGTYANGLIYIKFNGENIANFEVNHYTMDHGLPSMDWNRVMWNKDHLLVKTASMGIYKAVPIHDPKSGKPSFRFDPQFSPGRYFEGTPEVTYNIIKYNKDKYLIEADGLGLMTQQNSGIWQINYKPFRGIEGVQTGSYVEDNGVVWIPSDNGLYRYSPLVKKNYQLPYSSLIRQVKSKSGTEIFKGIYYNPQSKKGEFYTSFGTLQPQALIPTLKYQENSLTFLYSCLFFEHMSENRFQYQLVGFDEKWSEWTDIYRKEYTNIPEGKYCFKVRCKNIYDHPSSIAEYRFYIMPPWHRTFWAYLIYILLFILFLYGILRLNTRRLLAAKKKLENIVTERTAEVVKQKDEIEGQKNRIEEYADDLYNTNRQLSDTKNALWGEMELAKKIQTVLLPKEPKIPGYTITGYMKPADEVGGDYYDVINIAGKDWLLIGDVSGHGVPSGLIMMMVQTAVHATLNTDSTLSPAKTLEKVNQIIYKNIQRLGEDKYMTITVFSCIEDGTMYFSGLHQDIMIYRAAKKEVELVETNGMWIGVVEEIGDMLDVDQLVLDSGDVMFLYTDGITEATDENEEMFSDGKLEKVFKDLGHLSPEEIKEGILKSLQGYLCKDDVTMMILKRTPNNP